MSRDVAQIQIRDGGDLDDVRGLLDELGIDYEVACKEDAPPLPSHLLISSGAWAIETLGEVSQTRCEHHFLHLIVIDRASSSLRAMLQRQGCDMVARRPVHPTVLRLLLQRALYQGAERRRDARVAIGAEVNIGSELGSRTAVLAELSRRGCGLVTRQLLEVGDTLEVTLSDALPGASPLTLSGRVVGVEPSLAIEQGGHSTAVVFDETTRATVRCIDEIMREHAVGPTGYLEHTPGEPTPVPDAKQAARGDPAERRVFPRGRYSQLVLAREGGTVHSLIGRDLSLGGMRVAASAELRAGNRLQLLIYGSAGVLPVMVEAKVVRDDGDEGAGLSFDALDVESRKHLLEIVDSLDVLDSPSGTVVSEIVGKS